MLISNNKTFDINKYKMATLRAQDFELEFCYYNLNSCNEIEYSFEIRYNGEPFFNPKIISKSDPYVKNNKFIFFDCWDKDWLHIFFINILKTKKGGAHETFEPPTWCFEARTWEDRRENSKKSCEGKVVKELREDGKTVDVPYSEILDSFASLWDDSIEFIITFPSDVFITQGYSKFDLTLTTTFTDLIDFLEELDEEMRQFYNFFGDRIEYIGNGEYIEKDDFEYKNSYIDEEIYAIKRCAEWNDEHVEPDSEILLELLLNGLRWHGSGIVGTAINILQSNTSGKLAKEVFDLADKKLQKEKGKKIRKELKAIKTSIAVVFPDEFTDSELNNALGKIKKRDIPEEIFDKNKSIYLKYLEGRK